MKKIIILFFIFFVIAVCSLNASFFDYLNELDSDAEISFFCTNKQATNSQVVETQNGEGYIYTTNLKNIKNNLKIKNYYGFSIKYNKNNILNNILSKINILKKEKINNIEIYYGTTNGIVFSNFIGEDKINVQVAKSENYVVVGCPIIFGAY